MHHVAYEVDDVRAALGELAAAGAQLIDEEPRQGLFGLQVAFVHPDAVHGVLTEVVSVAEYDESVRIEIAFDGGQIMSALVDARAAPTSSSARSRSGGEGTFSLDASDGRYTRRPQARRLPEAVRARGQGRVRQLVSTRAR